jgi:pimeloyl-ACP methyl ester carboxylesterase
VFSLLFPGTARRLRSGGGRPFRVRGRSVLRGALIGLVTAYAALAGGLYFFQRQMVFPLNAARADPALVGLPGLEELSLTTSDGERLVVWHLPPREGRPVLLYFHGNAGNLARPERLLRFRSIAAQGIGFFAVSYRGYGGSTGAPSEAGLHIDGRAAYAEAVNLYGARRLVAYGESLGTGVASRIAVENEVTALVLETPYTSTLAVAQFRFPFVPVSSLMHDHFRTDEIVGRLRVPLLIVHGTSDFVIPFRFGETLYGMAPEPKRLVVFEGGGHSNLHERGAGPIVAQFLDAVAAGQLRGAEIIRLPAPRS